MALTHEFVRSLFAKLSSDNPSEFFDSVSDDVKWAVLGTHPLAGEYTSKASFQRGTFDRLAPHFAGRLKLYTRSLLVDGDTAVVELFSRATTKGGIPFNNEYCWICRFSDGRIVEVRAYLDSALVTKVIEGETV